MLHSPIPAIISVTFLVVICVVVSQGLSDDEVTGGVGVVGVVVRRE